MRHRIILSNLHTLGRSLIFFGMILRPAMFLLTGKMKTGSDGLRMKHIHGFITLIWVGYTRIVILRTTYGYILSQWAGSGQTRKFSRIMQI